MQLPTQHVPQAGKVRSLQKSQVACRVTVSDHCNEQSQYSTVHTLCSNHSQCCSCTAQIRHWAVVQHTSMRSGVASWSESSS